MSETPNGGASFATKIMDFFKGWFTDDQTGQFSWQKTALSVAGVGILLWAQQNMPMLFYAAMAFLAVGTALIASGALQHNGGGTQRADIPNLEPGLDVGAPGQEIQRQQAIGNSLDTRGMSLGALHQLPVTEASSVERPDVPYAQSSISGGSQITHG